MADVQRADAPRPSDPVRFGSAACWCLSSPCPAAPSPLGGVAECLVTEDLALPLRRPSVLRTSRPVHGLAGRGKVTQDALGLCQHGDELPPAAALPTGKHVER